MPRNRAVSSTKTTLPETVFSTIAFLLPGLNRVAHGCGITIGEWIIMWYLRQDGILNEEKHAVMLRQDLTDLLAKRGFGAANFVRLLNSLEDKKLVSRVSLSQEDRARLFKGRARDDRRAVLLRPSGEEKIEEFKKELTAHFDKWRLEQPKIVRKALSSTQEIANWLPK
jgi:DNA-binding MarR family transcriptional regulator